jgi:transcriptional regulator NrdR family protein
MDTDRQTGEPDGQRGIACPGCGCRLFRVLYTRRALGGRLMRRRACRHCGRRVTTYGQSLEKTGCGT